MDHVNAHLANSLLFVEYQFWGISDFRERPFNLKGWREKKIWFRVFVMLMLNSGKKFCALRDKINKYSNFRVVGKQISEQNKKP
jgi:hypothetical protein